MIVSGWQLQLSLSRILPSHRSNPEHYQDQSGIMSHFIASIVKPSKETKTQDVESPLPLSPEADIELTAPSSNATPPSPKEQLSKQLSITAKSLENKDEKQDSLTDPLRLDLTIGPSTSTNLPTADQPAPSSSPIDRRASIGAASSLGAWGPVTPRDEASDPLLLRSRLVGEQDIRRRPSVKGKGNEKNIKEFYENQNHAVIFSCTYSDWNRLCTGN